MRVVEVKCKEPFPTPRSGHRLVTVGNYVVMFGGYTYKPRVGGELKKEIWCYHTPTSSWKLIDTDFNNFPSSAASCAVVSFGSKLIVFGGSGVNFGQTNSDELHILDMKTLKWNKMNFSGNMIEGGFGHSISIGSDSKYLYLYGGCDGYHYFNTMNKICLETWNNETFYRTNFYGVYRHESVSHENKIMLFGGGNPHAQVDLGTIPYFCTATNSWHVMHANSQINPRARLAHSCNTIKDFVIVIGGQTKRDYITNENYALCDIWLFNLKSCSWTEMDITLPKSIFFHSAAKGDNDCLYVFGGSKYDNSGAVKRLNVLYEVKIFVPPLIELAWDVVSKHFVMNYHQRQVMHEIGVPSYILDRLNYVDLG